MLASKYEIALDKNEANYEPLSPIPFLERSALVYPGKPAIVDGTADRAASEQHYLAANDRDEQPGDRCAEANQGADCHRCGLGGHLQNIMIPPAITLRPAVSL